MTVAQLLDRLAAGTVTLAQVEADFRTRAWPRTPRPRPDGWLDDPTVPDPNSFEMVNTDSRLTGDAYQALARAYRAAIARA